MTAAPDVMNDLEAGDRPARYPPPQVLVEGDYAEVQDADGLNLGIQWANKETPA